MTTSYAEITYTAGRLLVPVYSDCRISIYVNYLPINIKGTISYAGRQRRKLFHSPTCEQFV